MRPFLRSLKTTRGLALPMPRSAAGLVAVCALSAGCATTPVEYDVSIPHGVHDARGRFGEIYCAVLDRPEPKLPDDRPCDVALSRTTDPPPGSGRAVDLGPSQSRLVAALVPGIGYSCVAEWLRSPTPMADYLRPHGYDVRVVEVDALSGTTRNARRIRDAIVALPDEPGPPRLVLVGYSKGTPDILEAIVTYPEIRPRIAAIVSVAGAVGGSSLADDAAEGAADLLRFFPGAHCDKGDDQAVASLRPSIRRQWLADHPLPPDMRFYSVVTLPEPDRISRLLEPTHRKLSATDARNDGQVIYADQIIPAGSLLAFVNADHWSVVLPIDRSHAVVGALLVNRNDYPREALLEAILRYVEEDIARPKSGP